jgi:hypothetical protein
MADRKPGASGAGKSSPAAKKAAPTTPGPKPPAKKSGGKSIVNQRQTPWGLIVTAAVIVIFALVVLAVALSNKKSKSSTASSLSSQGANVTKCTQMIGTNATPYLNQLKCAMDINGVTFHPEPNRDHVTGTVKYDVTPPVGGNHSQFWANCNGTVYAEPIANENAVHMLEHGAVWITYRPDLAIDQVNALAKIVQGHDHLALSPFPGLSSPISLQAWGYQLFVDSASDPRIMQFVNALQYNLQTAPENNASCSDPYFSASLSTPGHPQETPAS